MVCYYRCDWFFFVLSLEIRRINAEKECPPVAIDHSFRCSSSLGIGNSIVCYTAVFSVVTTLKTAV